jgi:hypothetical protein
MQDQLAGLADTRRSYEYHVQLRKQREDFAKKKAENVARLRSLGLSRDDTSDDAELVRAKENALETALDDKVDKQLQDSLSRWRSWADAFRQRRDYHAKLERRYEFAASHPWLAAPRVPPLPFPELEVRIERALLGLGTEPPMFLPETHVMSPSSAPLKGP